MMMPIDLVEQLKHLTVLYADDDPISLESTSHTLSIFFGNVITAKNGKEAWDRFCKKKVDMVILEVKLPKINGLNLAEMINEKNARTPVFMVSRSTEVEDLRKAVSLNLVAYLLKPLSYRELVDTLGICIKKIAATGNDCNLSSDLKYDYFNKSVTSPKGTVRLTKGESKLLEKLMEYRGSLVLYQDLMGAIGEISSVHALHNMVFRLRRKIGKSIITSVQDMGYVMDTRERRA